MLHRRGQPRFFEEKQPELNLKWNFASQSDWREIERLFIAAYMNSYCLCNIKDLGISNKVEQIARNKLNQARDQSGHYDIKMLDKDILSLLRPYFSHQGALQEITQYLDLKKPVDSAAFDQVILKLLMLQIYFSHAFTEETKKIAERSATSLDKIHYLIAYFHEHPVAFYVSQMNFKTGHVYMRWVTIAPGFQREHLGDLMLKEVERHFPEATGIDLYTLFVNRAALKYYHQHNFMEVAHLNFAEPKQQTENARYVRAWLNGKKFCLPADDGTDTPDAFVGCMKLSPGRY